MGNELLSYTRVKKDVPMNNDVISQYMNPG